MRLIITSTIAFFIGVLMGLASQQLAVPEVKIIYYPEPPSILGDCPGGYDYNNNCIK